ncbi:MAG: hypothetical protein PUP93_18990 [Rhizonema sp. NSF051]|nr:hypothetical protein [Rhizonema sp. NSF051]
MSKESIIKISKVHTKESESELQEEVTLLQKISLSEELQGLELEPVDMIEELTSMKVTANYHSGWKVSDILREIRLDSF